MLTVSTIKCGMNGGIWGRSFRNMRENSLWCVESRNMDIFSAHPITCSWKAMWVMSSVRLLCVRDKLTLIQLIWCDHLHFDAHMSVPFICGALFISQQVPSSISSINELWINIFSQLIPPPHSLSVLLRFILSVVYSRDIYKLSKGVSLISYLSVHWIHSYYSWSHINFNAKSYEQHTHCCIFQTYFTLFSLKTKIISSNFTLPHLQDHIFKNMYICIGK